MSKNDVEELLKITYQEVVGRRKLPFAYSPELDSYIGMVSKWLTEDRRPGLLLYGNYGAGKTTMGRTVTQLIAGLSAMSKVNTFVLSTTARELCDFAANDRDKFLSLKKSKMLYIDEVGREPLEVKNWGTNYNPLIEVIEYRYDNQMFTIMTANLNEQQIVNRYGPYIAERIAENFDKINYEGKSYRTGIDYGQNSAKE